MFVCTEQGIRDAIAVGGGPHRFDCDGPTTVTTEAEIVIDKDVILDGEGELTVDGKLEHRVFVVETGFEAGLRGIEATGGGLLVAHSDRGAGISNSGTLTLTNSTVSGNTAVGIVNSGTLTLTNSTVSEHPEPGILNSGTMALTNSTVSGNIGAGIVNSGTMALTNSTVSGNPATGIFNKGGTLTLTNSTVSGNPAVGIFNRSGTLTLTNSTVSGSVTGDIGDPLSGETAPSTTTTTNSLVDGRCNGNGDFLSTGYNIESPGDTCGFDPDVTDQVNVSAEDLKLGPLADNGGPTMTHALLPGSVAIDVIPTDMCEADKDQRGFPRDSMCDVGAFEVQP